MDSLDFVIRIGLKPMTCCLEGSCSIQLSYRTRFDIQINDLPVISGMLYSAELPDQIFKNWRQR